MNFPAMLVAGAITTASLLAGILFSNLFRSASLRVRKSAPGLAMVLGLVAGHAWTQPWRMSSEVESVLLDIPLYAALKEHEPDIYARLRDVSGPLGTRTPRETLLEVYGQLGGVIKVRLPDVADDVLLDYMRVTLEALRHLHKRNDGSCHALANSDMRLHANPFGFLTDDMKAEMVDVAARIIRSSAGQQRPLVSEAEASVPLGAVFSKLSEQFPAEDLDLLSTPLADGIDQNRYCAALIAMIKETLVLPEGNRLIALRFMVQP